MRHPAVAVLAHLDLVVLPLDPLKVKCQDLHELVQNLPRVTAALPAEVVQDISMVDVGRPVQVVQDILKVDVAQPVQMVQDSPKVVVVAQAPSAQALLEAGASAQKDGAAWVHLVAAAARTAYAKQAARVLPEVPALAQVSSVQLVVAGGAASAEVHQ